MIRDISGTPYSIYGVDGEYYIVYSDDIDSVVSGPWESEDSAVESLLDDLDENSESSDNDLNYIKTYFVNYCKKVLKDFRPVGEFFSTTQKAVLDKLIKSFIKKYDYSIDVDYHTEYDYDGYLYVVDSIEVI